jgi:RNA polymerase sigma-70 factor (ECF subfamily)
MSDELAADRLQHRLAEGHEQAFAELYDQFGRRMFRAAFTMLASRHDAEDVVQEVFMGLHRARSGLVRVNNLEGYVFAALRRAVGRRVKQLHRWRRTDMGQSTANGWHEHSVLSAQRSADLEQALQSLPPEQREVIALKVDAGLTFAEIGVSLGISPNTAASRYRYALEKLRSALRET